MVFDNIMCEHSFIIYFSNYKFIDITRGNCFSSNPFSAPQFMHLSNSNIFIGNANTFFIKQSQSSNFNFFEVVRVVV